MTERRLELVLLWHMHQPDYRDHTQNRFILPWVLLHAIKDYCDMVAHLERHPRMRAVVNFVPVLLDQIDDYVDQIQSRQFRDPLLAALVMKADAPLSATARRYLLDTCFRSNHSTMLSPFAQYQHLYDVQAKLRHENDVAFDGSYLSNEYFTDLVTWYFLVWSGETERRRNPFLMQLMRKGQNFTQDEREQVLDWIGGVVTQLVPRYRALLERGQIEISATPYGHPLAPLLLDFHSAREAMPDCALPQAPNYPGGKERLIAHIQAAKISHQRRFGSPNHGCWPAEGAISAATVELFCAEGIDWLASGDGVLRNSLQAANAKIAGLAQESTAATSARVASTGAALRPQIPLESAAHRPWYLADTLVDTSASAFAAPIFFRDDRLSDLIGFEYFKWNGVDAARHFVAELEKILVGAADNEVPVVAVMLDGENAWEHYPYNGYYFLDELYTLLASHPAIECKTFSEVCARIAAQASASDSKDNGKDSYGTLPQLVAGSWVYGTLSTWIGDAAKNRAWDLLCTAKAHYDQALAAGEIANPVAAAKQLGICESSDWFWWFGDIHPAQSVQSFDQLFRRNLQNLFLLIARTPPPEFFEPISTGNAAATHDGSMLRSS